MWIDGPIVARGGYESEEGEPLPPSFTGDSPLPMDWAELVRQLPNTGDAVASPSGRRVLVQRADSLLLLRVNGREVGPVMLGIHVGYDVGLAMVRWATPDETRRWNASLPGLEIPTIRVLPEQP